MSVKPIFKLPAEIPTASRGTKDRSVSFYKSMKSFFFSAFLPNIQLVAFAFWHIWIHIIYHWIPSDLFLNSFFSKCVRSLVDGKQTIDVLENDFAHVFDPDLVCDLLKVGWQNWWLKCKCFCAVSAKQTQSSITWGLSIMELVYSQADVSSLFKHACSNSPSF